MLETVSLKKNLTYLLFTSLFRYSFLGPLSSYSGHEGFRRVYVTAIIILDRNYTLKMSLRSVSSECDESRIHSVYTLRVNKNRISPP